MVVVKVVFTMSACLSEMSCMLESVSVSEITHQYNHFTSHAEHKNAETFDAKRRTQKPLTCHCFMGTCPTHAILHHMTVTFHCSHISCWYRSSVVLNVSEITHKYDHFTTHSEHKNAETFDAKRRTQKP